MHSPDWQAVRDQFPALREWTFLNTATYGQLPESAAAAMREHEARRDALACSDFLSWFDDMDEIRALVGQLIHCEASDVAFIGNAATGVSLLLAQLEWRPGDEILTLDDEFPNQLYAPALLRAKGVTFLRVAWEQFEQAIGPRTRLVVLSTVNYQTGFRPPLETLAALLRERGVLLYVDGTQSLGGLSFDVRQVQPDMLAVHGYKWLLSPTGAGFLYVSPELRARLNPNVIGWRSHADWRNVEYLHEGAPEFSEAAEKYEGGMLPFSLLYGMGASLRLFLSIGTDVIERRVLELAGKTQAMLQECGGELLAGGRPHYDSGITAARFADRDAGHLAKALKEKRILVSARRGYLRVSTHFYNNEEDVEVLRRALSDGPGQVSGCEPVEMDHK